MRYCLFVFFMVSLLACRTSKQNVTLREKYDSLSVTCDYTEEENLIYDDSIFNYSYIFADSIIIYDLDHSDSVPMPQLNAIWQPSKKMAIYGIKAGKEIGKVESRKESINVKVKGEKTKVNDDKVAKEKKSQGWRRGDWVMLTVVTGFIAYVLFGIWKKR